MSQIVDGSITNDPLPEMRLVHEQVQNEARMAGIHAQTVMREIDAAKKYVDQARETVEKRSHVFGVGLASSLVAGVLLVLFLLYNSLAPLIHGVVQSQVDREVNRIDWDKEIKVVVDASIEERLTPKLLDGMVDEELVRGIVSSVVQSPEFKTIIRDRAEEAARASVTSDVDQLIANTNNFNAIREEQIRAERDRLQAVVGNMISVAATDRDDLSQKLLAAIGDSEKLGMQFRSIDIYPFDDTLHTRARVVWQTDQPKNERVRIHEYTIEGLGATTDDRRETIANYLEQPSIPASAAITRSEDGAEKKFAPGKFSRVGNFATYREMSDAVVTNTIDLVDDCFKIDYPVTWRVEVSQ